MSWSWWHVIRWLHLVAMAFFVGGQLFLAAAVVPVERRAPDHDRMRAIARRFALRAIARRFGYGTLAAIAVLIATGSAMAGHYHQWSSGTLHTKLALVGAVAVLVVWHMRRPAMHALDGLIFLGSLAIVWLGISLAHGSS